MVIFATIFALLMLSLWVVAVAFLWLTTGALGGLVFVAATLALAWAFWPDGRGRMDRNTLNAFQQPLADSDDQDAHANDPISPMP